MPVPPAAALAVTPSGGRGDIETIALVGFAHGVSHFFHLLLPPLFPWLMAEFGFGFAAIGTTMTAFFVVSAIGQALAGFLVDRYGAYKVLLGGMLCFAAAGALLAAADGYAGLAAAAALAGLGNSAFHPADFTVLNRRVAPERLSHAFSVHGLSGNLGWAVAPVFHTAIASAAGWRWSALAAGAVGLAAGLLLTQRRAALADGGSHPSAAKRDTKLPTFAFLGSTAVRLCFGFFFLITTAFGAIQNFAAPILQAMYQLTLAAAASLSAYLLGGAAGIVVGGFLAQKGEHARLIALALTAAAAVAPLLASGVPPAPLIPLAMGAMGFCSGIAGPSRDLLVRRAATARFGQAAYGRVYGFVYSGLDAGLAVAPLVFGGLMDSRRFAAVLVGVALLQGLTIFTALRVKSD